MAKKAACAGDATTLESIPNIGPAIAEDLRQLGIQVPTDLIDRNPYALYHDLCVQTGIRHDPCLLDTFIAATRFMAGDQPKPWWHYTAERKRTLKTK
jgi:hypothetical protein